jgi:hypothetical protein
MALHLYEVPFARPEPHFNDDKTSYRSKLKGNSIKYLISTPQIFQGNENQRKIEKLSQTRGKGAMTSKCNIVS